MESVRGNYGGDRPVITQHQFDVMLREGIYPPDDVIIEASPTVSQSDRDWIMLELIDPDSLE